MSEVLETLMVICFGCSWPLSVYRSYKARSAAGKSLLFLSVIWLGYLCGIVGKILTRQINYVLAIYLFNLLVVSCDLLLYFRNRALDLRAQKEDPSPSRKPLIGKEAPAK